ncbi:anthrone oxygenase family protein [Streptomyces sp. NPDC093225]|uniref:anthrone oxygenase family protein n=1 Tax=Streptomyces sp. NPDC093225 TaxID=3366034 RepID=UPI0038097041
MGVLSVVTVVVVGMLVGVEFAVAAFVNPILSRLPAEHSLAARSDGARLLGRVMPFWYIGSMVLGGAWAAAAWGGGGSGLVIAATGLLVLSVVMSVLLLVPINSRAARWSEGDVPADWREQLGRWDRLHFVRVAVIVGAFVLLVVGLV